jgi:hypothetical protein
MEPGGGHPRQWPRGGRSGAGEGEGSGGPVGASSATRGAGIALVRLAATEEDGVTGPSAGAGQKSGRTGREDEGRGGLRPFINTIKGDF